MIKRNESDVGHIVFEILAKTVFKFLCFICDMIKRNESDVRDVVFEILAKTVFNFVCFILFLALSNPSYLCNKISNFNGVCIKIKHFEVMRKWCKKLGIEIF